MKIFDGKFVAKDVETKVANYLRKLNKTPKLVSLVVGDEGGAMMYQRLKQKAAERVGAKLEILNFNDRVSVDEIKKLINKLNVDSKVHGIMLQLPLPGNFSLTDRDKIIDSIAPQKDVDGMREDSPYIAPVVKAVLIALKESPSGNSEVFTQGYRKIHLLGSAGFVGKKIMKTLSKVGYMVEGWDIKEANNENQDLGVFTKNADILICATSMPDIISENMIKENAIVIDVGAPVGNLQKEAYEKCSFVTPVPGGIGPLTIACLMENLSGIFIEKITTDRYL